MEEILIFANPIAGRGLGVVIARRLEHRLVADGYRVRVLLDRPDQLDSCHLVGEGEDAARAAIVIGGDGTLRSVTQRLIDSNAGAPPPLLPIPLGTANLMGQHLGARWDLANIASEVSMAVRNRRVVHLDAGRANHRIFLLMVGIGFDAQVVHELDRVRDGPIQLASYLLPMVSAVSTYDYPAISVTVDERRIFSDEPAVAFIGNVAEYGVGFPVLPLARSDDGLLDICILPCRSRADLFNWALLAAAGEHLQAEGAIYQRGRHVHVTSESPLPAQMDGDPGGHTPVTIDLLPFKLPFIVG